MPFGVALGMILNGAGPLIGLAICAWTIVAVTRAWRGKTIASSAPPASLRPLEERMERLEQATEATALQVERIAEGQRFVTKLLSDTEHQSPRIGAPR